ncbi:MAG: hypothetical protein RBG13Loki_2351 [Promethearchaeota archaeon CR_4]|nr:MAG: hypothetical protein RBG13Loki_2351 [Candidatus Lokiarchaeota archaeon CR_4]
MDDTGKWRNLSNKNMVTNMSQGPIKVVKWFTEANLKGKVDEFVKKFEAGTLKGDEDYPLFYMAMQEAIILAQTAEDDDKKELYEIVSDDIEEYQSLAYFMEVRGWKEKLVMVLTPQGRKIGIWEGKYDAAPAEVDGTPVKNAVYMEMTPATSLQLMKGNPNTDPAFFSGDLTVKGALKLATKPREWIYAFMEFIGKSTD